MAERMAAALFLFCALTWAPGLEADEAAPVIFWLFTDSTTEFPSALVEAKGVSIQKIELKPARCTPPAQPDPALGERIRGGIDVYYSNDFEASESILRDVWLELGKGKDVLDIPPSWISECFAFRMLMFKAAGKGPEAEALAREATGTVHPSFLEDLDIPPDGYSFVLEHLEQAAAQGNTLVISTPQGQETCTLWVDGVRQPGTGPRLKFAGGVHWIRAACGGETGWTWRVEFPLHEGATLHLDPEVESRCACEAFPLVACADPMAGIQAMASNLLLYPQVRSCFVLKEGADAEGFFLSSEITSEEKPQGLQSLSWERLGEPPPVTKEKPGASGKAENRPRLNVPALVLAAAGSAVAGVAIGLGAGGVSAAGGAYTQKDPWVRAEEIEEASRLENAALVMAGLAASLLITSLIYHIVVYKKHKTWKKRK